MNFCYWIFLPLFVAGITLSSGSLSENITGVSNSAHEVLYLPNGKALEQIAFGHKNVLSDILWFKTISYFGAHFQSDKNYEWLSHMCSLVTDLDPKADYAYRFCATMLAWELNMVNESNALLTKAMNSLPRNWIFPYLRGFNHLYFLKEHAKAKEDLIEAARRPGVDPVIASLAAKKVGELDDPNIALLTIRGLMRMTQDKNVLEALQKRLTEIEEGKIRKND